MSGVQEKNNQYKSQYANALYSAGAADAQRRQAANEYAENYYAQAHAAKQQGKQMAMYNFLNQLNQYYSNEFKRNQFNQMMGMYKDNQKLDREKFEAWKNANNNNGNSTKEKDEVVGALDPKGKYEIRCCDGTACHVRGSMPVLNAIRARLDLKDGKFTTDDGLFSLARKRKVLKNQ